MTKKDKFLAAAQKYLEKGSLEKALAEFLRATAEDPKDTRTWLRIAEIHTKLGASDQATQVYLRTADLYVEQGFFQRAVAVYKNVLKLAPGHVDAHFKLADIYKQLGLFSDAVGQYETAAQVFGKAGKHKEALAALRQIVELNPEQPLSRMKLAEAAAQSGNVDEAVREFRRTAEQLGAQGKVDDYLRVAERILFHQPADHAFAKQVAAKYMERNGARFAVPKLQTVLQANPRDADALALLARAYEQLGQTPKTIAALKDLMRAHADDRRIAEAKQVIAQILALAPDDPDARELKDRLSSTGPPPIPAAALRAPIPAPSRPSLPVAPPARPPSMPARPVVPAQAASPVLELEIEPSGSQPRVVMAPPVADRAEEDAAAEVQRITAEVDVFVKYGLIERAAEHLQKIFDLEPTNTGARERRVAVLEQLGRKEEAAAELVVLAEQLLLVQPDAALGHARRALELDPASRAAKRLLDGDRPGRSSTTTAEPSAGSLPVLGFGGSLDSASIELEVEAHASDELLDSEPLLEVVDAEEQAVSVESGPVAAPEGFGAAGSVTDAQPAAPAIDLPFDFGQTIVASGPSPSAAAPPSPDPDSFESFEEKTTFTPAPFLVDDGASAERPTPRVPMDAVGEDEAEGLFPPAATPASPFPLADTASAGAAPDPFEAAPAPDEIASELEQIDFFLDQGLAEDAREMVDAVDPRFADHPALVERRVRLEALETSDRTQPHADRIDAGFAAALLDEAEQGAVPSAPIGVGREPAAPAVTPRAVISGGGAADLETHADLGIAYKEMGLWDAAVVEFNQLARDPRREVFALTMIGECHEAKGAAADAVVHYKRALNLPHVTDAESTQLYFQLGNVFQTLGDRNEALFFYEKVAKRDPKFRDVARRISELKAAGEPGRVAAGQTRR